MQRSAAISVALVAVHAALIITVVAMIDGPDKRPDSDEPSAGISPVPERVAEMRFEDFPDARDEPPAGWSGPVFRLSQAYPASLPEIGRAPWLDIDFRTQSETYLETVLNYALEGNVEVDFRGQDNSVRTWYHAPWLHAHPVSGREFIHGLTRERRSRPKELAPTQTEWAENWAVGMYNPRGGFVLGQVWRNRDAPDPTQAKFPEGAVGFKLLFTSASVSQVPFLKGAYEWEADIQRAPGDGPRPKLRLLQIDVAIRERRADSTTGWVFGTFIYNGDHPGKTVWDRMVPVGLMWGNDPDRLADGGPLSETVINPEVRGLVQHLGYRGRLNGPVDNPESSCLSCHSTAEIPADLSAPSVPGAPPLNSPPEVVARYFRNIPAAAPFSDNYLSLDYSLQLQNGIVNWANVTELRYPAPAGPLGLERRLLRASKGILVTQVDR